MPRSPQRVHALGVPVWIVLVAIAAIAGLITVAVVGANSRSEASTYVRPDNLGEPYEFDTPRPTVPKIAFIGDSWVGGAGADPSGPANSYAGIAATQLGYPYKAFTGGGTGYTTGNAAGEGPFGDRVDAAIEYNPDIVVVQGSSNDYQADAATIESAASDMFARLRAGLPDARIIVVGAIDSPASLPDRMNMIRSAVAAAAQANGAEWVDGNAEGWLDVAADFSDGFHPNNQGHQKVADHLANTLRITQ